MGPKKVDKTSGEGEGGQQKSGGADILKEPRPGIWAIPHLALAAVFAGVLAALVHHAVLAVAAAEPDGAGAGVVHPRVEARGAVAARPVVGSKVQVPVAQQASPT